MDQVVFYEKPGCVGNARQKALLRTHGIRLQVHDLLEQPWTLSSLRPYFGSKRVADWFNDSAPRVKSGELNVHDCSEAEALQLMIADPILIRRPLMRFGETWQSGFSMGPVLKALGLELDPHADLQSCPMGESDPGNCRGEVA